MTAPLDILGGDQTPPPVHGQAVMTQYLLDGRYTRIRLHYVRMAFSDSIDEVGAFKWRKLGHLAATILRVAWARVTTGIPSIPAPAVGVFACRACVVWMCGGAGSSCGRAAGG